MILDLQVAVDQSRPGWDRLLQTRPKEAGFEQSVLWANLLRELDHVRPFFLGVVKDGEPLATLLAFHHIPWDRARQAPKNGLRQWFSGSRHGWLQWHGGPTLYTENEELAGQALRLLFNWLDDYARRNRLFYIQGAFTHSTIQGNADFVHNLFTQFDYQRQKWATYQIDLNQDEQALWRGLKAAARKSVKKAQREGLAVKQIQTIDELKTDFYVPYQDFESAAGRATNPWFSFEATWRLDEQKLYRFYAARDSKDNVMAVLGMYIFNGVATEIASGLSPVAFAQKIPAQDFLHWEMIGAAKNAGCQHFDLAGVDPDPEDQKAIGIRRFKEKWGGEYVEFPSYRKSLRFNLLNELRR